MNVGCAGAMRCLGIELTAVNWHHAGWTAPGDMAARALAQNCMQSSEGLIGRWRRDGCHFEWIPAVRARVTVTADLPSSSQGLANHSR